MATIIRFLIVLLLSVFSVTGVSKAQTPTNAYVNTDCGNNGDGTSASCAGAPGGAGAYNSCSNAISGEAKDLVSADEQLTIHFQGSAADTTYCDTVSGSWATDATRFFKLQAASGQEHGGVWNTGKYRLSVDGGATSGSCALKLHHPYTQVVGLQIENSTTSGDSANTICPHDIGSAGILVKDSLIKFGTCSTGTCYGIRADYHTSFQLINNIIYGGFTRGVLSRSYDSGNEVFYNNTIVATAASGAGFWILRYNGASVNRYYKNNILQSAGGAAAYYIEGSDGTVTTANNITNDSTSPDGASYQGKTTTFTDSGGADYSLDAADTAALDNGANLSADGVYAFSIDINGTTRSGTWDIGAWEGASGGAGGGATPETDYACGRDTNDDDSVDNWCTGNDADWDGYAAADDCDDNNWEIHPGSAELCDSGGGAGSGWRKCQANGTWTSCTAHASTPFCEATGSGNCYYIDCDAVSNGDGSYASPWNTTEQVTYLESGSRPAGWVQLSAGDAVYFLDGVCDTSFHPSGGSSGTAAMLYVRDANPTESNPLIIRAYPGASASFTMTTPTGGEDAAIRVQSDNYVQISDLIIADHPWTKAIISTDACTNLEVRRMTIYGTDGDWTDNNSAIDLNGCQNCKILHNRLYDNHDPDATGAAEQNNSNTVMFTGSGNEFAYNIAYYTNDASAILGRTCFVYKHGTNTSSDVSIHDNVFYNCGNYAVATAQSGSHIYNNYVQDGWFAFTYEDIGGPFYPHNLHIERNTVVNALAMKILAGGIDSADANNNIVEKNVFVDDSASYPNEQRILEFGTYESNAYYNLFDTASELDFKENCYYNSASTALAIGYWTGGESYGGEITWAQWQAGLAGTPFRSARDDDSYNENPSLSSLGVAQSANCSNYGIFSAPSSGGGSNLERFLAILRHLGY